MLPLNDNIFIKEHVRGETVSDSGIISSLGGDKEVSKGTVYKVPKKFSEPFEGLEEVLGEGDEVLFSKYSIEQIVFHDEKGNRVKNLISVHAGGILAKC